MNILGKNNTRINFKKSDSQNKEFAFMKAHELNNIEHLIKVSCEHCNGEGKYTPQHLAGAPKTDCPRCHGYGHYYTKNIWRTGKNTNRQLIIETDNNSKENLSLIINHLNKLFGYKFNAIKTLHGFHIIGSKIYPDCRDSQTEQTIRNIVYPDTINTKTFKTVPSDQWYFDNLKVLQNNIEISNTTWKELLYQLIDSDMEMRKYCQEINYKELFTNYIKTTGIYNCVGDFDVFYTTLSIKYGKSTLRISKKQPHDKYEEVNHDTSQNIQMS